MPSLPSSGHLSRQAEASHSLGGHINTHALLTPTQVLAIQVTSCVLSGISLLGSAVTLYWFSQMRKKFRHKLILILILADVIRSTWLFLYPLVYVARNGIRSTSAFCQAAGFFTQTGIETADFAILFMALHTSIQILRPDIASNGVHDGGLNRYRYFVYTFAAVVPSGMSALAFIDHGMGYMAQGPTCSLPLRPFWYRLAISWVPRYIIMIVVVCLYLAIYIHVARHFGSFKKFGVVPSGKGGSTDLSDSFASTSQETATYAEENQQSELPDSAMPDEANSFHKPSTGTTLVDHSSPRHSSFDMNAEPKTGPWTEHEGLAQRFEQFSFAQPAAEDHLDGKHEEDVVKKATPSSTQSFVTSSIQRRHRAIRHQLNMLFVYPVCYFGIWLMPFVLHACNYSSYLVQHPIFAVEILAFVSVSLMGAIDCLIFSLREKPWQKIPGSDGTFLNSFCFWTHGKKQQERESICTTALGSNRSSVPRPVQTALGSSNMSTSAIVLPKHLRGPSDADAVPPLPNTYQQNRNKMAAWDFARGDGAENGPVSSQGRQWFDRSLSFAVGKSIVKRAYRQDKTAERSLWRS